MPPPSSETEIRMYWPAVSAPRLLVRIKLLLSINIWPSPTMASLEFSMRLNKARSNPDLSTRILADSASIIRGAISSGNNLLNDSLSTAMKDFTPTFTYLVGSSCAKLSRLRFGSAVLMDSNSRRQRLVDLCGIGLVQLGCFGRFYDDW
jgi:hypothetical protein